MIFRDAVSVSPSSDDLAFALLKLAVDDRQDPVISTKLLSVQ